MQQRITFFLPSLEGGGAEKNTIHLLRCLPQEKYRISLMLCREKGFFLSQVPEQVELIDLKSTNLAVIFWKVFFYLLAGKTDVFISTFPRFNLVNILADICAGKKVKMIIIEQTIPSRLRFTAKKASHKFVAHFLLSRLIRRWYRHAWRVIAISEAVKKDLRFMGLEKEIEVIYNPVIGENIAALAREEVTEPWFERGAVPVVVAAGRLTPAKDYPLLLRAFALVVRTCPAELVLIGEGEEKGKIMEMAANLGIADKTHFLAFQQNHYKYLAKSQVFVSSSQREGFSNSIVEAMWCGCPVVATAAHGPEEIITDGKNGVLVPVGDETALASSLVRVLTHHEFAEAIAREGKRRAGDFTIGKSVEKYEQVFNSLN